MACDGGATQAVPHCFAVAPYDSHPEAVPRGRKRPVGAGPRAGAETRPYRSRGTLCGL